MLYHCSCVFSYNRTVDIILVDVRAIDISDVYNEVFSVIFNNIAEKNNNFCFIGALSIFVFDVQPFTKNEIIDNFRKIRLDGGDYNVNGRS